MFRDCKNLTKLDTSKFDTSNVTNMGSMFSGCNSLKKLDVSGFDTSNVTKMDWMFSGCNSLTELDVSGFDTSKVTNVKLMFNSCSSIKELDVSGFNTSNVTDMGSMFSGCKSVRELDVSGFDTSKVTEMRNMFSGCSSITELDVSRFDTSNVTDMESMFLVCSGITELDVSGFDTSNVTNTKNMFSGCSSITELNISGFDTSNVTEMESMFSGCKSIRELDVSRFDTGKVTNMEWMFSGCSSLTELDVNGFDTNNVTDMKGMFSGCSSLTELDVSRFDTSNVTDMCRMFFRSTNLKELNVSGFDTSNVTDMEEMFGGCKELTWLDLRNFVTNESTLMDYMLNRESKNEYAVIISDNMVINPDSELIYSEGSTTIICEKDSKTQAYAIENNIKYLNSPEIKKVENGKTYTGKVTPQISFAEHCNIELYKDGTKIEGYKSGNPINKNGDYMLKAEFPTIGETVINFTIKFDVTVTYNTTKLTNGDVLAIIESDAEMQPIDGWEFFENKNMLTKTYSKNCNEKVTVKNIAGDSAVANINITNIDKTAPKLEVSYSITTATNKNVVVTITANEAIRKISGWTLSEDNKKLTRAYSLNNAEMVAVKDIVGNIATANVKVSNIDKTTPTIEGVKENQKYYKEVTPKAKDDNLKTVELYKEGNKVNTYKNGDKITEKGNYKIVAKDSAGNETTVSFKIVSYIPGDVNGNGKVTVTDLLLIKKSLVKLIDLTEEQKMRGDINSDEKITVTDLLGVKRIILKLK